MDLAVAGSTLLPQPTFEDGLGERRYASGAGNESLELLRLRPALTAVSSFEFALRERVGRLAGFRHSSFTQVRAIELDKRSATLVVVSSYTPGVRLSMLLAAAERRSIHLPFDAARCVIRHLVEAMAAWQDAGAQVSHGAIAPERIIITPEGRVVVAEYVLGAALEQLRYSRARYWTELRVAVPSENAPFDGRVDVTQIGAVALALLLGRRLADDEYGDRTTDLIPQAMARTPAEHAPASDELRQWLLRALQRDPSWSFGSSIDAWADLDVALGPDNPVAERMALQAFMTRCAVRDAADGSPITLRAAEVPAWEVPPGEAVPAALMPELGPSTHASAEPVYDSADDFAPETVDLSPRIDAMKSFLARYPKRRADDEAEAPEVPTLVRVPPVSPPPPVPPAADAAAPVPPIAPAAAVVPDPLVQPTPPVSPAAPVTVSEPAVAPAMFVGVDQQPGTFTLARLSELVTPRTALIAGGVLVVAGLAVLMAWLFGSSPAATGSLSVVTNPAGLPVRVDGTGRGISPLELALPPGDHVVEVVSNGQSRKIPVKITAGGQVSQFLELPAAAAVATGSLQVRTEPPGASVTIDGRAVGRSPVSVADLTPGEHTVLLSNESGSITERVSVQSGRTESLVVSLSRPEGGATAGWISLSAPVVMQVFENGRLLGTSGIDRIMLPVGRHELEIVNDDLLYRVRRTVQVSAGQVSNVGLEWPKGNVALNAIPWAEVLVDGAPVGDTPIGNLALPIGVHEIVFRHPELGERTTTVTVTVGRTAAVGVDFRTR